MQLPQLALRIFSAPGVAIIRRAVSICVTAAVLSGCGVPATPTGSLASIPSSVATANADLLYVAAEAQVDLFTYPQGRPAGSLGVAGGAGICADRTGNVYIPITYHNEIVEYPHGSSTPIATLYTARYPEDCTIDPTTGTLAVTFVDGFQTFSHGPGGWGAPRTYTNPDDTKVAYCTYDSAGNLFIDGYTSGSAFRLIEMPADGSGTFTAISLDKTLEFAGGLRFHRGELTILESVQHRPTMIYRFNVARYGGTYVGSTVLNRGTRSDRFLIDGSTIVMSTRHGVGFWRYPAGGEPKRVLGARDGFYGVALSASHRF